FPGLAAVARALHHLSGPGAGLRGIEPVRIGRRSLDVVNLPSGEMGSADLPILALAVRRQDEGAFACANQHSYFAHFKLLSNLGIKGVESRSRHRRLASASTLSRFSSIFTISPQGAPVRS